MPNPLRCTGGWAGLSCALLLTSLLMACGSTVRSSEAPAIEVYAAGSLREAFTQIAARHEAQTGQAVKLSFGASGLLRERIEKGEGAQVFASADTEHPERLAARGDWQRPQVFTRNSLCALTSASLKLQSTDLQQTLLDPQVRVATSTPRADPSGDYAWALFKKADALQAGAYAALDQKALQLTGAVNSPRPPAGRNAYAWLMEQGKADVFLTYCTNATAAQKELPSLRVVAIPPNLQVGAAYGLTLRKDAPEAARRFAQALLGAQAQSTLQALGFGPP